MYIFMLIMYSIIENILPSDISLSYAPLNWAYNLCWEIHNVTLSL